MDYATKYQLSGKYPGLAVSSLRLLLLLLLLFVEFRDEEVSQTQADAGRHDDEPGQSGEERLSYERQVAAEFATFTTIGCSRWPSVVYRRRCVAFSA